MEALLHQLSAGIVNGSIYASVGLALVMIDMATHHINFAQGEMATFSTFCAWKLLVMGVPYWTTFLAVVVLSFVAGVAIQRLVLRRFEKAAVLNNVVVFVGLLVIFNATGGLFFGHELKQFPSPFEPISWLSTRFLTAHGSGSILVMLGMLALVFSFFKFSRVGLAMRASAYNPDSAALVGIKVSWMLALGWGLAAAVGAVAGLMIAPVVFLDAGMMGGVLLYGFAAALLGGLHNPWGAVIGGFIVGIVENLLGAYVTGTDLKLTVALILIVLTLTLMPQGLFGKTIAKRV